MLTVLIPTTARSAMLRQALQSVADQTARDKISRVFVSENAGDRGSQEVCAEFPQLPITYLFREPALPPLGHAQALMKECLQSEFTAILHDDDWWLPGHVEAALLALEAHPDASVYGANYVGFQNDELMQNLDHGLVAWVAANYPVAAQLWRISASNVLLGSLLNFFVHYSSMVIRTEALRQSAYVYELGNPYDNDRMILFALSRVGAVLFNHQVHAVVRAHAERETARFKVEERNQRMRQTTEWMVASGLKPWSMIASALTQRLGVCPSDEIKIQLLRHATVSEWCLPEIARHLDRNKDTEFFAMYDRARQTFAGEKPGPDR